MAVLRVSIIFTIGCFVLVTNSALSFLPFIGLKTNLPYRLIYVEGILSVVSCGLFLVGSVIAFSESVKASAGRGGYFGWELEDYSPVEIKESAAEKGELYGDKTEQALTPPQVHYTHGNSSHEHFFGHSPDSTLEDRKLRLSIPQPPPPPYTEPPPYVEQPNWGHVTSAQGFHVPHCNLSLIASGIFLCSSLIYTLTAIASLVTILSIGEVFRAIRYPQIVAGGGFVIGSILLLIKSQKDTTGHWWKPALRRLAWHVNLWNLIGSVAFVFCACFGLFAHVHWSDFQFNCSYLWGSWAFLLGSVIQWYKARHKMKFHHHLMEKFERERLHHDEKKKVQKESQGK
jgi:hypothetical protein